MRVIVRSTYPGAISGHRGPGYLVTLDRPVGGQKVVLADPTECRQEPPQRAHATCRYCPKPLASCNGGRRLGGGQIIICSPHGPCFRKGEAELARKHG